MVDWTDSLPCVHHLNGIADEKLWQLSGVFIFCTIAASVLLRKHQRVRGNQLEDFLKAAVLRRQRTFYIRCIFRANSTKLHAHGGKLAVSIDTADDPSENSPTEATNPAIQQQITINRRERRVKPVVFAGGYGLIENKTLQKHIPIFTNCCGTIGDSESWFYV